MLVSRNVVSCSMTTLLTTFEGIGRILYQSVVTGFKVVSRFKTRCDTGVAHAHVLYLKDKFTKWQQEELKYLCESISAFWAFEDADEFGNLWLISLYQLKMWFLLSASVWCWLWSKVKRAWTFQPEVSDTLLFILLLSHSKSQQSVPPSSTMFLFIVFPQITTSWKLDILQTQVQGRACCSHKLIFYSNRSLRVKYVFLNGSSSLHFK